METGMFQARRYAQIALFVLAFGGLYSTVAVAQETETSAAPAAALPKLVPSRLREERLGYQVKTDMSGMEQTGTATLSIAKDSITQDGEQQDVWRLEFSEQAPLVPRGNIFILRQADLGLVERHMVMQMETFEFRFGDQAVFIGDEEVPLPLPVIASWDVSVLALPLAEGFETFAHTFEVLQGAPMRWQVAVEAVESVEVPAGTFESYKVALSCLDNDALSATAWVTKDAPYRIVRRESAYMPTMAPDSTMLIELASIEDGPEAAE